MVQLLSGGVAAPPKNRSKPFSFFLGGGCPTNNSVQAPKGVPSFYPRVTEQPNPPEPFRLAASVTFPETCKAALCITRLLDSGCIQPLECGSKLNRRGYAGFGPCFHLPGFHFGTGFLSHSHFCVIFGNLPLKASSDLIRLLLHGGFHFNHSPRHETPRLKRRFHLPLKSSNHSFSSAKVHLWEAPFCSTALGSYFSPQFFLGTPSGTTWCSTCWSTATPLSAPSCCSGWCRKLSAWRGTRRVFVGGFVCVFVSGKIGGHMRQRGGVETPTPAKKGRKGNKGHFHKGL